MRLLSAAVCTTVAAALLAACSGSGSSPSSSVMPGGAGGAAKVSQAGHHGTILTTIPKQFLGRHTKFHGIKAPQTATRGIYVQEFYATTNNIFGYPKNNSSNGPQLCNESTGSNVNDIATDGSGNLIVPNAFSGVNVYAGPGMCGALLGTATDAYGQASSAAANDATTSMVVGNIGGGTGTGVVTCAGPTSTCTPLQSPNLAGLAGVAMDAAGNCYADGFDINTGTPSLWVYTLCTGTGAELTSANGFSEPYYGGLDVDNHGNLVVVSLFNSSFTTPSTVTVYSGCATGTCTVVGGPFALQGESVFGHLGRQNERYTAPNITDSMIDVYAYTGHGTGLSYMYSFNNGLSCATYLCESSAYSPRSPK